MSSEVLGYISALGADEKLDGKPGFDAKSEQDPNARMIALCYEVQLAV